MSELIGIQGIEGSYHEAITRQMHPETDIAYYATFSGLFNALREQHISSAVAAISNNRYQFIPEVFQALTTPDHPFVITGEGYLRVEHALMAPQGANIRSIREVHSQAPALGQCGRFLETVLAQATVVEEFDTASSARGVAALNDPHKAAIASEAAAEVYGLEILQTSIQDDKDNITRFLELKRREDFVPTGEENKTTVILHTPQAAGSLVSALKLFQRNRLLGRNGINISSLQSQFIPNSPFEMKFFMDVDAGLHEPRVQKILKKLDRRGYVVEVLGTYQRAEVPLSQDVQ